MENSGQKYISWLGRGFYFVFNYSYVLAGLQMKLHLLLPSLLPSRQCTPGVCSVGSGAGSALAAVLCWDALGQTGC